MVINGTFDIVFGSLFGSKLNVHSAYRKEKKSEFKMIAIKYNDIYPFTNFNLSSVIYNENTFQTSPT